MPSRELGSSQTNICAWVQEHRLGQGSREMSYWQEQSGLVQICLPAQHPDSFGLFSGYTGLDSKRLTWSFLAGRLLGQGPRVTVWGRWVQIKDLVGMGKESLWFAGATGTSVIPTTYSFYHCSSPRCQPPGPSRCPSSQLCPYGKVCRSSQYKHPLTESLQWEEKPPADDHSTAPLLYFPTHPKDTQTPGMGSGVGVEGHGPDPQVVQSDSGFRKSWP